MNKKTAIQILDKSFEKKFEYLSDGIDVEMFLENIKHLNGVKGKKKDITPIKKWKPSISEVQVDKFTN